MSLSEYLEKLEEKMMLSKEAQDLVSFQKFNTEEIWVPAPRPKDLVITASIDE